MKQRGGLSQRRAAQKKIFQPTKMVNIRRGLTRSKCSTRYIAGDTSLRRKEHRDFANDNRVPPLLDRTPQKHQEAEGKKSRTGSTFKTEVETTKVQL
jgi:hypothetical protein